MRFIIGCICCLTLISAQSQLLDLAKSEYLYVPGSNSNFEYHRQQIEANVPFKLNEGAYFFVGFDYSRILFRFQEAEDSYNKANAENFQSIDLNLTYTFEMKNNWRFGFQLSPSFNSNFQDGIVSDDFLVNGVMAFIKTKDGSISKKRNRLIIGLAYSTTTRFPIPFPFVSYYRKFHPKWSYTVGAPYTNIQFHATDTHRFKLHAEGEAFNTHVQEDIQVDGFGDADRIRVFFINVGFRYEYKLSEHIESYLLLSRTVFSDLQLRNGKDVVFQPVLDNAMLFRLGIRCKI